MEISKGNKLIAEFMGGIIVDIYKGQNLLFQIPPDYSMYQLGDEIYDGSDQQFELDELAYHSSWDWIIPVFIKCKDLLKSSIKNHRDELIELFQKNTSIENNPLMKLHHVLEFDIYHGDWKISNVYTWCVEFIKWYNENKTI
jgi:hypothetical protein